MSVEFVRNRIAVTAGALKVFDFGTFVQPADSRNVVRVRTKGAPVPLKALVIATPQKAVAGEPVRLVLRLGAEGYLGRGRRLNAPARPPGASRDAPNGYLWPHLDLPPEPN